MLIYFKYFLFILDNISTLFSWFGIHLPETNYHLLLPIGISYYTFQTLGYVIDIYRKRIDAVTNYIDYALFVAFFPQILAGPIERAATLLPQIQKPRDLQKEQFNQGLYLIYLGLFKKLFIADNLGILLQLYANPINLGEVSGDGGIVLISAYAFLFQLYCDFSSYTDIARGSAKLMGIELMENFNTPFFAPNIQDTWSRWHISLTTWMRDYLYYPLALMRIKKIQLNNAAIIVIVFIIIGLWHGATWTFVLWGGYHGLLLATYALSKKYIIKFKMKLNQWQQNVHLILSIIFTFHLSVFGALFFRAQSFGQMSLWLEQILIDFTLNSAMIELLLKVGFHIVPLLIYELIIFVKNDHFWLWKLPRWLQYIILYISFYLIVVHGAKIPSTYIYFQF